MKRVPKPIPKKETKRDMASLASAIQAGGASKKGGLLC